MAARTLPDEYSLGGCVWVGGDQGGGGAGGVGGRDPVGRTRRGGEGGRLFAEDRRQGDQARLECSMPFVEMGCR